MSESWSLVLIYCCSPLDSRSSNFKSGDTASPAANLDTPYQSCFQQKPEGMEKELLKVHRSTVKKDMISTFLDSSCERLFVIL